MLAEKRALRAKALADATLISLLGGSYVYQRAADIVFESLFAAGAKAIITYWWVTGGVVEEDTGLSDQTYQFDVWSKSSDDADAAAERLDVIIPWSPRLPGSGTLPALTGRRLANVITSEAVPPDQVDMSEAGGTLHHKVRSYRVRTYPA